MPELRRLSVNIFEVTSDASPDRRYKVRWRNNRWECECGSFIAMSQSSSPPDCKHTRAVRAVQYVGHNAAPRMLKRLERTLRRSR